MHIGWGNHFSLWEERLFVEGVEALSVLQGLGSGLPLKMYWTWESYCDSSKVSHRGGQKSVIGNTILKEHVFFCICICFIVTWNDQFITFFIVKYTFQCPTFILCAYDPYVYPFWIKILPNVQSAIHLQLFSPWLPERFYSSSISFLHELFKWLEDLLSQPSHYYIKISTYLSDCGFFCVFFLY